jgi:hypothetical protein
MDVDQLHCILGRATFYREFSPSQHLLDLGSTPVFVCARLKGLEEMD